MSNDGQPIDSDFGRSQAEVDGAAEIEPAVYDGRAPDEAPVAVPAEPKVGKDVKTVELELMEDPRDAMVKNYRTARDDPDFVPEGQAPADEQPAQGDEPAPQHDTAEPVAPAPRQYRVKVLGGEQIVTEDELIRNYSKSQAADIRLAEANRLFAEATRLAATAPSAPINADGGDSPPEQRPAAHSSHQSPPTDQAEDDDAALRSFVESVQLGTTEEAVEAARKLLRKDAAPQQPVDISGQVERVIADRSDRATSRAATEQFFDVFKIEDNLTAVALEEASRLEMARDLSSLGLPMETVLALDMPNISKYHKQARLSGRPGFRQPDQILLAVAENPRFRQIVNSGMRERPMNVQVDRSQRKAQVQQQPALRSYTPPPPQQSEAAREKRGSDIVRQMREARGQPALGG